MCDDNLVLSLQAVAERHLLAHEPGFYRLRFGRMTITALCDGHFPLSAHDVLRSGKTMLGTLLEDAHLGPVIPSHVNAFLIDDGARRMLIDAGAGDLQDATLGRMAMQLAAAGYRPGDIDIVLATHLHPDHIGGLTRNGEAVFPRALVYVPREEAAFWLGTSDRDAVDASVQATFEHARQILAPYIAEGRYRAFDPEASWYGYLTAESLPGHTSGHTGYRLHTYEQDLVFCGDLFHVLPVQLAEPGVTVCYDSEPALAMRTRATFLAEACRRGDIVGAAHAPFPGLGQVGKGVREYAWHPVA